MGLGSMFGGSEEVDLLTGRQRGLIRDLSIQLEGEIGQSGPVYEGQITPDATANQQLAFDNVGGLLGQANQADPQIQAMLQGQSANGIDPAQYAQESIYDPAKLAYDDAREEMEAMYGGSWGQTGGYQDIMQKGAARFGVGIGNEMAEFARYQQDTGNQNRAMGVDASFGQTRNLADTYGTLLGVGGEERSIEGQRNNEDLSRWQQGQDYNNPWLGFLGPALGTQAFAIGQQEGWVAPLNEAMHPL